MTNLPFSSSPSGLAQTRQFSSAESSVLTVDFGNSQVKFGLLQTESGALPELIKVIAVNQDEPTPWSELERWAVDFPAPSRCLAAGVNPPRLKDFCEAWLVSSLAPRWPQPQRVTRNDLPLEVAVEFPDKVGIDRLLNAVAANLLRQPGEPVIVVSAGTATTVDLVSAAGAFLGGCILPGIRLGALALHHYTALLPLLDDEAPGEPRLPGRNTVEAMRNGLVWGQLGAVRELVARLGAVSEGQPATIFTGGAGEWLSAQFPTARYEAHLPLKGLASLS